MSVFFKIRIKCLLAICAIFFYTNTALAEVSIIANKNISATTLTAKMAKKIFLGKKKSIEGGGVIKLADLPIGNQTRNEFYKSIVKKKEKQLKAYWAKVRFTGKGFPPQVLDSEINIVEWVAKTPGAMAYVSSSAVNDTVNVLYTK